MGFLFLFLLLLLNAVDDVLLPPGVALRLSDHRIVFLQSLLLFDLLVYLLLQEGLSLLKKRIALIEIEVVEVAQFLPKPHQEYLLDDIALIDEVIDFDD